MRIYLKLSIIYYTATYIYMFLEDHVQNDDHGDQPENTKQKDQKFIHPFLCLSELNLTKYF